MTEVLDREVRRLRAAYRALAPMNKGAQDRALAWLRDRLASDERRKQTRLEPPHA